MQTFQKCNKIAENFFNNIIPFSIVNIGFIIVDAYSKLSLFLNPIPTLVTLTILIKNQNQLLMSIVFLYQIWGKCRFSFDLIASTDRKT